MQKSSICLIMVLQNHLVLAGHHSSYLWKSLMTLPDFVQTFVKSIMSHNWILLHFPVWKPVLRSVESAKSVSKVVLLKGFCPLICRKYQKPFSTWWTGLLGMWKVAWFIWMMWSPISIIRMFILTALKSCLTSWLMHIWLLTLTIVRLRRPQFLI